MGFQSVMVNAYFKNVPYICLGFAIVSVFALNDAGDGINNLTNVSVSQNTFNMPSTQLVGLLLRDFLTLTSFQFKTNIDISSYLLNPFAFDVHAYEPWRKNVGVFWTVMLT